MIDETFYALADPDGGLSGLDLMKIRFKMRQMAAKIR